MLHLVTEMTENRRWNAYVCPACRLVFKLPDGNEERGACCPACQQVLQIPDRHSSSILPIPNVSPPAKGPKRIRKRRKRNRSIDNLSWEKESGPRLLRKGRHKRKPPIFTIIISIITGGLFAWLFVTEERTKAPKGDATVEAPIVMPPPKPQPQPQPQTKTPELDTEFFERHATFITQAEELAGKFLSAQSVEELRPLVRNPDTTIPRILKLHPDGKIDMGGLLTFNPADQFRKSDEFISVTVRTKNYDERTMVFAETADGIRVDWESWAGWCEMGWEEFMAAKPTTGTLFRVKLNNTNYYNFNFSEEARWRSYTLLSHDEKYRIYGYVESGSQAAMDIGEAVEPGDRFFTLSLKFPENAESNNQVIIERVISNGWIVPTTPPP